MIDRDWFHNQLVEATVSVRDFTLGLITQDLPKAARYLVLSDLDFYAKADQSGDSRSKTLEESRGFLGPFTADEAVDHLFRNGEVPEWVDISVEAEDRDYCYYRLLICPRFSADTESLYYTWDGTEPFGLKGPSIPLGWESVETSGKFDLYSSKRIRP